MPTRFIHSGDFGVGLIHSKLIFSMILNGELSVCKPFTLHNYFTQRMYVFKKSRKGGSMSILTSFNRKNIFN